MRGIYVQDHGNTEEWRLSGKDWLRFCSKVELPDPNGCLNWMGMKDKDGYGRFKLHGKVKRAHKLAYLHWMGTYPEGMTLDHLCRNPACVNPNHLEVVTVRENTMRGNGFAPINAAKTHCRNDHPYDEDNTYILPSTGERICKVCRGAAQARWKAKNPNYQREWRARQRGC